MRLARFHLASEPPGTAGIGIVSDDGEWVADLRHAHPALASDVAALLSFDGWRELVAGADRERRRRADVVLRAPVARPGKFLAVGRNYADHAAELHSEVSEFPVVFNKQSTCVNDPGAAIEIPPLSAQVDYEGELGVVIGRRCRAVAADDVAAVIGGYVCVNDVSVRDWQRRSPTMTLGKSWDTHGPLGPWMVTSDEIPDPHRLHLRTLLSGEERQSASTAEMIHRIPDLVAMLSTVCTLEPGDVISTGTPAGVGAAADPPRWLVPGDEVTVEIDGIGRLTNPVVAAPLRPVLPPS